MEVLRQEYRRSLAGRLPALEAAARDLQAGAPAPERLAEIRTLVHRLRGSAALYGYGHLVPLAEAAEEPLRAALQDGASLEARAVATALAALREAVAAVVAGGPA